MSTSSDKQQKARMAYLRPGEVRIPDVRVTSQWDPELLKMFSDSIRADGIQAPLIVVWDGTHHWLVDGLHRLEEAKLGNLERIPCAVLDGDLKTVMLRNLYLNRLHGKTPATEMAEVLGELQDTHGMNPAQIAKETGLREEYIDKYLRIHRAEPEVLQFLDQEKIGVGHAAEIARVEDRDVQLRLLAEVVMYDIKVQDTKEIVDRTLEILSERARQKSMQQKPLAKPVPTAKCALCEQEHQLERIKYIPMCRACFGESYSHILKMRQTGWQPVTPAERAAERITQPGPEPGSQPAENVSHDTAGGGPPHEKMPTDRPTS
jgi:ParB-like chromosome segregation protein Spo0J